MAPIKRELQNEVTTNESSSNESVLTKLVMDLQKQITELKNKDDPAAATDKREHYKWPLAFSYKLWDWVPVLDYKSTKKDSTRWLTYRAVSGELVDNHYVDLTTTDWELKKSVLLYDFSMWFERSEKQPAGAILKDWTVIKQLEIPKHVNLLEEVEWYVFDTQDFGQIKVSPKIIN